MSWKGFFAWSQTAVVLCTEVHKRREKVRGGERVDARRNNTMSKVMMLYVAAMKVNCVRVIKPCIHSPNSVANRFLNGCKKTERNEEGPT